MTSNAEKHLAAAKEYVAKGEGFYLKAAAEMKAAKDDGATWVEIADNLGRADSWVRRIVAWYETPANDRPRAGAPFGGVEENTRKATSHARGVLREAPPEQIAEMLSDPEIRAKVSHAQDIASSNLQARSRKAERQALGERESDDLAEQQILRDAEAELFKARRALIETLRLLNQASATLTDSWREEFLRTFDDIGAKVDLGRGLLVGALDDELDNLLAEEAR